MNDHTIDESHNQVTSICNTSLTAPEGEKIDISKIIVKGNEGYILKII